MINYKFSPETKKWYALQQIDKINLQDLEGDLAQAINKLVEWQTCLNSKYIDNVADLRDRYFTNPIIGPTCSQKLSTQKVQFKSFESEYDYDEGCCLIFGVRDLLPVEQQSMDAYHNAEKERQKRLRAIKKVTKRPVKKKNSIVK